MPGETESLMEAISPAVSVATVDTALSCSHTKLNNTPNMMHDVNTEPPATKQIVATQTLCYKVLQYLYNKITSNLQLK